MAGRLTRSEAKALLTDGEGMAYLVLTGAHEGILDVIYEHGLHVFTTPEGTSDGVPFIFIGVPEGALSHRETPESL